MRLGLYRARRLLAHRAREAKRRGRAENPFATHVPVLVGLAQVLPAHQVLEFGCGDYSTLLFLNRDIFPQLVSLKSYENDVRWAERVQRRVGSDKRFDLALVEGEMSSVAAVEQFDRYDIVFIDDSKSITERAQTILAVASRSASNGIVLIHDFERREYRDAAESFRHHFRFSALSPHTGLCWNDATIDKRVLRRINRLIQKHRRSIKPDDLHRWIDVLKSI